MRNYLPVKKRQSAIKRFAQKLSSWKLRPAQQSYLALAFLLVVTGSVVVWTKFAHAYFSAGCANTYGTVGKQWDSGGFHYQARVFTTGSNDRGLFFGAVMSSQHCGGDSEVVNTAAAPFVWNGQRAVAVQLGVPENIKWASPQTIGSIAKSRPPEFARNWDSYAAFTDDAGEAGIQSARFGKHTIWCWRLGVGDGEVGTDGYDTCAPWSVFTDPNTEVQNTPPTNGAGWFFTQHNCHFSNPDVQSDWLDYTHDNDSRNSNAYPAAGRGNLSCDDNDNFLWYNESADPAINRGPNGRPVAALMNDPGKGLHAGDTGSMDLSTYIGCSRGNCNGTTQPVDSFTLRQYAENTSTVTISATQTVLTFKYPIAPDVTVTKTPKGAQCGYNITMGATCTGGLPGASYWIYLKGTNNGSVLRQYKVVDTIDPQFTTLSSGGNNCGGHLAAVTGNTLTWNLDPGDLATLNAGGIVSLCLRVQTIGTKAPVGNQAFINTATGSGTSSTGLSVGPTPSIVTNFISSPDSPYLTTSGGDVHAGGCNLTGNIQGQSGGGSKGDYIVSASGSLNSFKSGAANSLGIISYYNVCRPDLLFNAYIYLTSPPSLASPVINDTSSPGSVPGDLTSGPAGKIVYVDGSYILPCIGAVIHPVTLVVTGNLIINCATSESTSAGQVGDLGSLGVVANNIYIEGSVQKLEGFFYAKQKIVTCSFFGFVVPATAVPSLCQQPLTVIGLLSAGSFDFNRGGNPAIPGLQPAETANYTGLLFLAPPPLFTEKLTPGTSGPINLQIAPPLY